LIQQLADEGNADLIKLGAWGAFGAQNCRQLVLAGL
jgi:hypothetical protein